MRFGDGDDDGIVSLSRAGRAKGRVGLDDDFLRLTPLDESWLSAVEIELDLVRGDGDSSGLLQLLDSTDGEIGYSCVV